MIKFLTHFCSNQTKNRRRLNQVFLHCQNMHDTCNTLNVVQVFFIRFKVLKRSLNVVINDFQDNNVSVKKKNDKKAGSRLDHDD